MTPFLDLICCLLVRLSLAALAAFTLPSYAQGQSTQSSEPRGLVELRQLMRQGHHAEALQRADKLIIDMPEDARPRFLKAVILTELERPSDALALYKKLTQDFPELPEPYNNLGVLYAQQRQYELAKDALEAAVRANPGYAIAHENLGDLYLRLATQEYGKALQTERSNAAAQRKLAALRDLLATAGGSAGK
jgi:Flp pilus assembly protein TadD